jgi:hypothetical protein
MTFCGRRRMPSSVSSASSRSPSSRCAAFRISSGSVSCLSRAASSGPSGQHRTYGRSASRILLHRTSISRTIVALLWHDYGMPRVRLSTTVDEALLARARRLRAGATDAVLLDEALNALVARNRAAEIDAGYKAYDQHPIDEPDEWGDLASFREAAGAS